MLSFSFLSIPQRKSVSRLRGNDGWGSLVQLLCNPHFDQRLPRYAEGFGAFVEAVDDPDWEIHVDALQF